MKTSFLFRPYGTKDIVRRALAPSDEKVNSFPKVNYVAPHKATYKTFNPATGKLGSPKQRKEPECIYVGESTFGNRPSDLERLRKMLPADVETLDAFDQEIERWIRKRKDFELAAFNRAIPVTMQHVKEQCEKAKRTEPDAS